MITVRDIATKCAELEIKALEKHKYEIAGEHRTTGSYVLTFMKASLTSLKKDPEMYNVKIAMDLGKYGTIMAIGAGVGVCIHNYISNKKKSDEDYIEENFDDLVDESDVLGDTEWAKFLEDVDLPEWAIGVDVSEKGELNYEEN